jgi:putative ABC transport system permease protein
MNQATFMTFEDAVHNMVNIIKIVLMLLLGGVASITLLVAGIGVMNIMLVIVAERTREIGLRKALGASRRDILVQFIIEAIILCIVGGILGIVLGYFSSELVLNLANNYIKVDLTVPLWSVLVSLIFTSAVGLFFGIYPAIKASRLDPIEALHYE